MSQSQVKIDGARRTVTFQRKFNMVTSQPHFFTPAEVRQAFQGVQTHTEPHKVFRGFWKTREWVY